MSVVIEHTAITGIVAHATFVPLFYWLGVSALAVFNMASVLMWMAARQVNRREKTNLAVGILTLEVAVHAALAVWLVGWDSGFHYYLIPLVPFVLFNDRSSAPPAVASCLAIAGLYVALRLTSEANPAAVSHGILQVLDVINFLVPIFALGTIAYYFRSGSVDIEKRMEALAMTDALTDLPNRRRVLELLKAEVSRVDRGRKPFAVLIADLDHFKAVNDTYGHDCGDAVLTEFADVLRTAIRSQDVAARWGGEEFLLVLAETDPHGAECVAEKIRAAVEAHTFRYQDKELNLTITIGLSCFRVDESLDTCVRNADEALYRGKRAGRNRISKKIQAQPAPDLAASP